MLGEWINSIQKGSPSVFTSHKILTNNVFLLHPPQKMQVAKKFNTFEEIGNGIFRFFAGNQRHTKKIRDLKGAHVTIVGGVHGNERIGVKVLDEMRLSLMQMNPIPIESSIPLLAEEATLTLVYANQHALCIGQRGSVPHADLNRCFPVDLLQQEVVDDTLYEYKRAKELGEIFIESDVMIDLHSTNKPSEPFIRLAGKKILPQDSINICRWLPCDILLSDPNYLLADGKVALTDEFVGAAAGGIGICYESGHASDLSTEKVNSVLRSIWRILQQETKSITLVPSSTSKTNPAQPAPPPLGQQQIYEITQVFKLTEKGFRWAEGVGDENFQFVPAKTPIGYVEDGDFTVNYDSYIVFPKIPSLWKIGSPLGWLTKKIK